MARPLICRRVACDVPVRYFKPQGVPMRCLDEIALSLDEIEAMRLTDIEDLYQADAALKMGVSRQTLGNILARAHKKVATALMEGKALRISIADETIQHPGLAETSAEPRSEIPLESPFESPLESSLPTSPTDGENQ